MKESYATKLCPQNCTHLYFILSKFVYHQCIWQKVIKDEK